MSEKRFKMEIPINNGNHPLLKDNETGEIVEIVNVEMLIKKLNEQQELIEELEVSDEMGWKRAEHFEKKCPKELHNKKMYIKRLEYKVQKFKEENEQLRQQLLICQQSKNNNDGRFQVWEVPPISQGTRITFSTTEKSGKNE